jgi:hypothetical protein
LVVFAVCVGIGAAYAGAAPAKGKTMNLAFVLLQQARLPKAEEIARAFGHYAAVKDQRLLPRGTKSDPKSKSTVLEFELSPGGSGFVALMPVAVPNGEADDAARLSVGALRTGWKLPAHSAHLVVTLQDPGAASLTDALSRFTSFVASVVEASGAVGVYWGNAGATHDAKFFMTVAREHEVAAQMMLWTGVSLAREADGRLSFLSTGMKQLELPDLLLIAPKSAGNTALATFFDLLIYLAQIGKPLPEGDTVGRTADERLPVHYVTSPVDRNAKVWRVELK